MVQVTINGRATGVEPNATLVDVLRRFDVAGETAGIAVAVNGVVVAREQWAARRLRGGDVLEIIRAVQGG